MVDLGTKILSSEHPGRLKHDEGEHTARGQGLFVSELTTVLLCKDVLKITTCFKELHNNKSHQRLHGKR
jgi:hypothetical protein